HRAGVVRDAEDGRGAPLQRVPQARDRLARAAAGRARRKSVGFRLVEGPLVVTAGERRVRRPVVGYVMVLAAAALFGVNGSVAKVALSSGLSSLRLSEARCAGACIGLMLAALPYAPASLRVRDRRDLGRRAVGGVRGVALGDASRFPTIH